jgi:hypothetical protein
VLPVSFLHLIHLPIQLSRCCNSFFPPPNPSTLVIFIHLPTDLAAPTSWDSWEVASGYDSSSRPQTPLPAITTSTAGHTHSIVLDHTSSSIMEDDSRNNGMLRPFSQPALNSRFPSLRRLNSTEPYRHRSLPAEPSPGSDRASSEITFAVLYDDGPDYHVGQYDDQGSMRSQQNRPDSMASFAPSFRTRDSRLVSDDHYLDRNQDFVANQRLLAEGYLNNNDSLYDQSVPRYPTQSEETLAMNTLHNSYPRDEKRPFNQMMAPPLDRNHSKHSHESWCTCEEDHGHGHGHGHAPNPPQNSTDRKDPSKFDLEGQNGPATPTPFLPKEKPSSERDQYEVCFALIAWECQHSNAFDRSNSMAQVTRSIPRIGPRTRSGLSLVLRLPSLSSRLWHLLWSRLLFLRS